MNQPIPEQLEDLTQRTAKYRRRFYAQEPKKLSNVMARIIAQRGIGKQQSNEQLQTAWSTAAGPELARFSRAVAVRRGKLEVLVASSLMMQEIGFARERIVAELQEKIPEARIIDLKLRVGQIN
jgi:hypothetical protein